MDKSLYYIECTCIKDVKYPNIEFHVGDIFYYNKKASSSEMYLYCNKDHSPLTEEQKNNIPLIYKWHAYLPFTRQKKNAKKWQIKRYADWEARIINDIGEFNAVVKEIKITYTEEEV